MKPKVLITREITSAISTAACIEALGFEAVVCPLIEIELVEYELPKDFKPDYQIITSLNAAKVITPELQNVPCLVVGGRSAEYLSNNGFNVVGVYLNASELLLSLPLQHTTSVTHTSIPATLNVAPATLNVIPAKAGIHLLPTQAMDSRLRGNDAESVGGNDAESVGRNDIEGGSGKRVCKFLYLSADHIATDIPNTLSAMGHEVRRVVVYKSKIISTFKPHILKGIDFITFYSLRTAKAFCSLCKEQSLSHITALCLSPNVAEGLKGLRFKNLIVAKAPKEEKLLKELPYLKF